MVIFQIGELKVPDLSSAVFLVLLVAGTIVKALNVVLSDRTWRSVFLQGK